MWVSGGVSGCAGRVQRIGLGGCSGVGLLGLVVVGAVGRCKEKRLVVGVCCVGRVGKVKKCHTNLYGVLEV